jgi:hypothetical protein
MSAGANIYQYPPGDFRWRLWLLMERIDEVFIAGRAAGIEPVSFRDPRHEWALMQLNSDPLVAAVWNCDQVLSLDHRPDPWPAMLLADAEEFCEKAERWVVDHARSVRLRETPRYKEVHERICHLMDLSCRAGGRQPRRL